MKDQPMDAERKLELKVGVFVLLAVVVGLGMVVLLGKQRHVFESRVTLHAEFPDVQGLKPGAPVWLSGVNVGTVTRVALGPLGKKRVRVDLEISRKMLDRVRRDSTASIGSQGLLGDKLLQVAQGTAGSPPVGDGDEIAATEGADFNRIVAQASEILDSARTVADNAAKASKALADPKTIESFRGAMSSLHALLGRAEVGAGLAHSLFYDKRTADSFQNLSAGVDRLVAHVDHGVKEIDAVLSTTDADGRQVINNLSRAAKGVGDASDQLRKSHAIANLEHATGDLSAIMAHARAGQGTVGALFMDPTVYEQLVTVLGGVERSRILRALVRYAISKSDGMGAARVVETPPPPPKRSPQDRAKR